MGLRDLLLYNIPFLFTKMSKLLLLFSLRSIYIYLLYIQVHPHLVTLGSHPFFLWIMEVRVVGEAILKGDFGLRILAIPKNSNSLTPNKYCISTNHTSIIECPVGTSNLGYYLVIVIASHEWCSRILMCEAWTPQRVLAVLVLLLV